MQLNKIPVVYSPKQCADIRSFSPSPSKPQHVMRAWEDYGFPLEVIETQPVETVQFMLAHNPEYVLDILALNRMNGFGNTSRALADSLYYTVGSMVQAAHLAVKNKVGAVSPTSGFHHAGYDYGGGFCTFNGLMVAALSFGFNMQIGILDCDQHYGDGTDDIIRHTKASNIIHHTQGSFKNVGARRFLGALPDALEKFKGCDILLYQAGADPHVNDPLGGWMTTEQLYQRDKIVFQFCKEFGIPVAWNLAGGYQDKFDKVLEIHINTMKAFNETFIQQEI